MEYIKLLKENVRLIFILSVETSKRTYFDTKLGFLWAILKQVIYVVMFAFFFKVGIRQGDEVNNHSYILYLFSGTIPWMLLSEATVNACRTIHKNGVIIRNYNVPLQIIPIYEMISRMMMHIVIIFFLIIFFALNGGIDYAPSAIYLNFIYYWILLSLFITGLNYLFGALAFVIKDITNFISAIMQGYFWVTPIIWEPIGNVVVYEKILNPYYFFINGYRETLLDHISFINDFTYDLYIWAVIFFLYYFGYRLYTRVIPTVYDNI